MNGDERDVAKAVAMVLSRQVVRAESEAGRLVFRYTDRGADKVLVEVQRVTPHPHVGFMIESRTYDVDMTARLMPVGTLK